jgi:small GTP-binding protein
MSEEQLRLLRVRSRVPLREDKTDHDRPIMPRVTFPMLLPEMPEREGTRAMVQKKICLLGAFAVGKTSLVTRFVDGVFPEKYHTTVGVRLEKKTLQYVGREWHLLIWDLAGEDEFLQIHPSYLRGSSGYLLVADGTRRATLEAAVRIQQRARDTIGDVPFVLMMNKSDLADEWEVAEPTIKTLSNRGWTWLKASAKTGVGVEEAFLALVGKMMEG